LVKVLAAPSGIEVVSKLMRVAALAFGNQIPSEAIKT
jgi:hypothetical protein